MNYLWNQLGTEQWECVEHGLRMSRLSESQWMIDDGSDTTIFDKNMVFDSKSRMFIEQEPVHTAADPFQSVRIFSLGPQHFSGGKGGRKRSTV